MNVASTGIAVVNATPAKTEYSAAIAPLSVQSIQD